VQFVGRENARSNYASIILERGLADADASSIEFWLEATVRHLGWRKVFSTLRGMAAPWPRAGASALYHVPFMFLDVYPLSPSLKQALSASSKTVRSSVSGNSFVIT
jgi:hypothetical protein